MNTKEFREYYRKWREGKKDSLKVISDKTYWKNREKKLQRKKEYYQENKGKSQAQNRLNYLVRMGKIKIKGICEECDSTNFIIKHHPDYSEPLVFQELCKKCHNEVHLAKHE